MIFHIDVERSIETVFELIRDLRGYKSWLPASSTFSAITDISDDPVRRGTTYSDRGPAVLMRGEVTEMEPPRAIAFQQTTKFKRGVLRGELTLFVRYNLEESRGRGTLVTRELRIRTTGIFAVVRPVLVVVIRKEDERILQRMKMYLEARVG